MRIVSIQEKVYKERKAQNSLTSVTDAPPVSNLTSNVFVDLFDRFNDDQETSRFVAEAIHVHLGSPSTMKIATIQWKVWKERKVRETSTGKEDKERKRKCEVEDMKDEGIWTRDKGVCDPQDLQDLCEEAIAKRNKRRKLTTRSRTGDIEWDKCMDDTSLSDEDEEEDKDRDCKDSRSPTRKSKSLDIESQIEATELAYLDLPEHVCSCCRTLSFEKSLQSVSAKALMRVSDELRTVLKHDDEGNLINKFCSMCKYSLMKGEVLKFSYLNGPCFVEVPEFIKELNPLEARLVAPKLAFGSIYQLPKGGQFGLKGGVISVAADMSKIQTHLPRTFEECATLNCDLKRRLVFTNAYMSSLIRPSLIMQSLNWLKEQPLYKAIGVSVREDWNFMTPKQEEETRQEDTHLNEAITQGIARLRNQEGKDDCDCFGDEQSDGEEVTDLKNVRMQGVYKNDEPMPLESSQACNDSFVSDDDASGIDDSSDGEDLKMHSLYDNLDTYVGEGETLDQSMDPKYNLGGYVEAGDADHMTTEELRSCTLNIAPGEGMPPKGLNIIPLTEELTHPHIFGGQPRREEDQNHLHKIRVRREMMNEDRRAARDIHYNFFQMRKLQQLQVQSMAYISMRKGTWGNANFTAGLLKTEAGRDQILRDDHGYNELADLRGSPHALLKLKKDVYAMMRQKGPPTLFLTFSAADSHWTHMLVMLYRTQKGIVISPDEALKLPWATKSALIRADPISVARYYEYRMRHFFDNLVVKCPELLGRVTDYV